MLPTSIRKKKLKKRRVWLQMNSEDCLRHDVLGLTEIILNVLFPLVSNDDLFVEKLNRKI